MQRLALRWRSAILLPFLVLGAASPVALAAQAEQETAAQAEHRPGGEVNLLLPDLNQGDFLGFTGHQILLSGWWSACSASCSAW